MYYFESRVRYSEVDPQKNMTFGALLNYFQDSCTFQSEDLGVGVEFLQEIHSAWILISWQVVVKRCPLFGEKIKICTWPYDFGGFYGYRNFTIESEQGEMLAYANSVWVFMDTESRKPAKIAQRFLDVYEMEPRFEMEYENRKIAIPKENRREREFLVHPTQIDTNHHVNNEQYIEMAQLCLPDGFEIRQMRADYRKSAVLGDTIYPLVHEEGGRITVTLADENGKPYALVEFGSMYG